MAMNRPTRPTTPQAKPVIPAIPTRERIVKRYVASCPVYEDADRAVDCSFNQRPKPRLHGAAGSAVVEAVHHIRAIHAPLLVIEKQAKRTVAVQRTLLGEELID